MGVIEVAKSAKIIPELKSERWECQFTALSTFSALFPVSKDSGLASQSPATLSAFADISGHTSCLVENPTWFDCDIFAMRSQ